VRGAPCCRAAGEAAAPGARAQLAGEAGCVRREGGGRGGEAWLVQRRAGVGVGGGDCTAGWQGVAMPA
jgi:hypothetical protein